MDYYDHPEQTLPSLNAANQSDRQQRSERREACLILLCAVIHYTDLATLKVGIPKPDGSLGGLTLARLSDLTQLGIRRTQRAMSDLKRAGIIAVKTLCQGNAEQGFRGIPAIKSLSPHLFAIFGLDRWLLHEQRRASDRNAQRAHKQTRKVRAQCRLVADRLTHRTRQPSQHTVKSPHGPSATASHHLKTLRELLGLRSPSTPSNV